MNENELKTSLEKAVKRGIITQEQAEAILPELKESEDEKIRKSLIKSYTNQHSSNFPTVDGFTREQILAWLEKQGEQKPMKVYRVENEAEQRGLWRKFDGTWQPLFDMLTDGKCKDMPMENNPIYREGGKRWFASAPSKKTLQKWFSKRDLEELVSKGFTISEFEVVGYKKVSDFEYIFTRDNIINRKYLEVSDIYSEQKDFAPKFKVGDIIIVDDGSEAPFKVNKVLEKTYELIGMDEEGDDYHFPIIKTDNEFRLWTIEDAKDGDVLVHSSFMLDDFVFIYNSTSILQAYCYYSNEKNRLIIEDRGHHCPWNMQEVTPATKEQCETLFKAIHEAGYKWDAEKKELKKIEQKPAENEELTEFDKAVGASIGTWNPKTPEQIQAVKAVSEKLLKLAKKQINNEQSPAWGEKEEEMLRRCISATFDHGYLKECDWLKSLKNLVQPQPKPEWSEEDEKKFIQAYAFIENTKLKDVDDIKASLFAWLKSLKSRVQPQWKPSDEQIEAVRIAAEIGTANNSWAMGVLKSMYQDFKKTK